MNEHQLIKQVLHCLEQIARRCRTVGTLEQQPAQEAMRFFREYADGYHHQKEESVLFPLLEAKGLTEESSLTGDLIAEHALGRFHVDAMEEALSGAVAGDPAAVERFVRHARDYVRMLRRHIRREDDFLFPMADVAMEQDERASLLTSFEEITGAERFRGKLELYEQVADRLAERYGVAKERVLFGAS